MSQKLRLFWAISLPREIKAQLPWEDFKQLPLVAKWVLPEQLHLTLAFLGEVEQSLKPSIIAEVQSRIDKLSSFNLELGELGFFPNAVSPKVLLLGLAGQIELLRKLQQKVRQGVEAAGCKLDRKPFVPHLTLARIKAVQRELKNLPLIPELANCPVASVQLFSSKLTPQGSIYRLEKELKLCPLN